MAVLMRWRSKNAATENNRRIEEEEKEPPPPWMDWQRVFVLILIDIKLWPQIFHVLEGEGSPPKQRNRKRRGSDSSSLFPSESIGINHGRRDGITPRGEPRRRVDDPSSSILDWLRSIFRGVLHGTFVFEGGNKLDTDV